MASITARTTGGDIIFEAVGKPGEDWQETLSRAYNEHHGYTKSQGAYKRRGVAAAQHFAGGGTWHVQMGYHAGYPGGGTNLDTLIVVQVED